MWCIDEEQAHRALVIIETLPARESVPSERHYSSDERCSRDYRFSGHLSSKNILEELAYCAICMRQFGRPLAAVFQTPAVLHPDRVHSSSFFCLGNVDSPTWCDTNRSHPRRRHGHQSLTMIFRDEQQITRTGSIPVVHTYQLSRAVSREFSDGDAGPCPYTDSCPGGCCSVWVS